MRFDFHDLPFFDNHTHLLKLDKTNVTEAEFIENYYHGGDDRMAAAREHLPYQGVILTLVNQMADYLGCHADLKTVLAARNKVTATPELLKQYIHDMYADENIVGTTLDCEFPMGDERTDCFPCEVFRLFQYEKPLFALLKSEEDYDTFLTKLLESIRTAKAEGFAGLKGHVAERYTLEVYKVDAETARKQFAAAKNGDKNAEKEVYFAAFTEIMLLCGEIGLPIHLHTGSSGFGKFRALYTMDPVLMANYLSDHAFDKTKVVFLHGSYPYIRHSAMMAFNYPNVYMDLSQTLPWDGMTFSNILEDTLALAPHDKITLGSGQHFYSETAWLASRTAKSALAWTMDKLVDQRMLNEEQAMDTARKVLSENALRLYGRE